MLEPGNYGLIHDKIIALVNGAYDRKSDKIIVYILLIYASYFHNPYTHAITKTKYR